MHYKCYKNLSHGGSYIDCTDWVKSKKKKTNIITDDDKYFQYAETIALNYEEIGKKQKLSQIKSFMHNIIKYEWKGINYSLPKGE